MVTMPSTRCPCVAHMEPVIEADGARKVRLVVDVIDPECERHTKYPPEERA